MKEFRIVFLLNSEYHILELVAEDFMTACASATALNQTRGVEVYSVEQIAEPVVKGKKLAAGL